MKKMLSLLMVGAMAAGTSNMYAADQGFSGFFGGDDAEGTGVVADGEGRKRQREEEITPWQQIPATLSSTTNDGSDVQCGQRAVQQQPRRGFTEAQVESTASLFAVEPTRLRASDDRRDVVPFDDEYEKVLAAGRTHIARFIDGLTASVVEQYEKNETAAKDQLATCVEQELAKLLATLKSMSSSRQGLVTRKALLTLICEMASKALEACEEEDEATDGSASLAAELGALIATKAAEMMAKPVRETRVTISDADDAGEVLVRQNASLFVTSSDKKKDSTKSATTARSRRKSSK